MGVARRSAVTLSRLADENVRAAALGFVSADPDPAATGLLLQLQQGSSDPARIVALLARPSPGRVSGLVAALEAADEERTNLCCSLLARLRTPESLLALLQILQHGPVATRKAAAVALASLRTPQALAAVTRSAEQDPDARVRQICSILLGE